MDRSSQRINDPALIDQANGGLFRFFHPLLRVTDIDLFNFFRWTLGTIVTIYATVITVQSLWGWYVWLAGSDRYMSMLRRYVIVHGLRLRFTSFWGDVIICLLLCLAFVLLWRAHVILEGINGALHG
ncbi:MAG: hypothetical protein IT448_01865 [Phycisphaerales bacterium]|nr:hypothetical protein [Phycisphaerales bacterium]